MINKVQEAYNFSIIPEWARKKPDPTPEEVWDLIKREAGDDVVWPGRFEVLIKLYKPEDEIVIGDKKWKQPEDYQKQYGLDTRIGRILGWGPDAFTSRDLFPNGSPWTIGQWILFLKYENSFINVGNVQLAYLQDVKLTFHVKDPTKIDTTHVVGK